MGPERLQKILAGAGIASRRKSEEYILQGRVSVDGQVITELGTKVDPHADIRLDGERVSAAKPIYIVINKPRGFVSSSQSEAGKPPVTELVPHITQRLFCVGRLDAESSGLVLLTNDGTLTQRLTHPSFEVPKTYEVIVRGAAKQEALDELRKGVYLSEGRVKCDRVTLVKAREKSSTLEIEIHQGVNREIRRVLAKVGFPVSHLKRTAIASLELGRMALGHHRKLTAAEIQGLYDATAGRQKVKPSRKLRVPRRKT